MLTKILVYGYCVGTSASRRIERRCQEDVGFRLLAANNMPDFRTISDFRKRHLKVLHGFFLQILQLCQEAGLVKLGHVALDGTKQKANASKHKAMSYGRMKLKERELKAHIKAYFEEADRIDGEEDRLYGRECRGDELPAELQDPVTRLQRIREAMKALKERERSKSAEQEEVKPERPVFGKPPKPRRDQGRSSQSKVRVNDKEQYNFTDPQSRIMVAGDKSFQQAYNCQAAVDSKAQVIVACEVVQEPNDKKQLEPMLKQIRENVGRNPKQLSADAGYWSEEAVRRLSKKRMELLVPPKRIKHREYRKPCKRGPIPTGASFGDRMMRKLRTKRGKAAYSKRKENVEPVFGQIKQARGFRQFLLRGKEKVSGEWSLICTTHNILKLWRSGMAPWN